MGFGESVRGDDVVQGSAFLARQLELIKKRVYARKFPEITSERLIALSDEMDPGAESITYQVEEAVGAARIISSYADDMPKITVTSSSETSKVVQIALGFDYTIQEVRASQLANRDLPDRKAIYALQQHVQLHDKLCWVGDSAAGVPGLTSHKHVPRMTSQYTWDASSTGDQILSVMNLAVTQTTRISKGVEKPNTFAVPSEQYSYIASTPRANSVSDRTILEYFQKAHHEIDVEPIPQHLDTAGTGGVSVAVLYNRDSINVDRRLCSPPNFLPPQAKGLNFDVPGESRHAGVAVYYPFSVIVVEAI